MSQLIALALTVVALALLVRWLEPRLAFFPFTGETETPRDFGLPFEAVTIDTADGERLRAWRMLPPAQQAPRARILYFHGNGGNLSNWASILAAIARHGYAVFAIDYRGYGLSTGRPTERGLYRDVDAAVAAAWPNDATDAPIVYWGRSLDARAAIRGSPVLAALSVFASYRFPAGEFLTRARVPVLVMHGDRDSVIPFTLGRELFAVLPEPRTFVAIPGGDHNDAAAPDPAAYWAAIDRFIGGLAPRR
jgi:alpha-beta hydrolase superfamily lysophospholipase